MKRNLIFFLATAALAVLSGTVNARDHVSFSVSIGTPGYSYVAPPPVYYEPVYYRAPVYYAPAPVYYAPARTVYVERGHWYHRRHDKNHHHGRH